jgi:hypothetical protein
MVYTFILSKMRFWELSLWADNQVKCPNYTWIKLLELDFCFDADVDWDYFVARKTKFAVDVPGLFNRRQILHNNYNAGRFSCFSGRTVLRF